MTDICRSVCPFDFQVFDNFPIDEERDGIQKSFLSDGFEEVQLTLEVQVLSSGLHVFDQEGLAEDAAGEEVEEAEAHEPVRVQEPPKHRRVK